MMDFNLYYVKALYSVNGPKSQKGVPLSNQLAVAGYIAMRVVDWGTGDNGYASIATMAEALGMSPKTTGNAINALEKQGWLDVKVRRNRSSIYKLSVPEVTQPLHQSVESTEQPLPTDVTVTAQPLPTDVTVTAQPLPTDVNLDSRSVTFASRSVTVTDDLYIPIKNLRAEDAREDDDATNTPQQDDEVEEQTIAKPPVLDRIDGYLADLDLEQVARGVYLLAKTCGHDFNQKQCSAISFKLKSSMFDVEEMREYITEKMAAHSDTPAGQLAGYIAKDASVWLLESRERARAIGVYDGPTYRRMELPDEPEEVKAPEPELTEEQKQKIRDDFDRMMREGIDPFAVRMSQ